MKIMNPKLARATKKPLAAQPIKNAAPAGRPKSGIGMIGGPKPSMPTPVNPSPARPPLNAAPVTGVTRGRVEQNYRGIPGLVDASMDMPNFGGVASNSLANVGTGGLKRSRADFGMPTPPSTNVNPVRPGMLGAGAPQGQRTQSGSMAAMGGAATGMLKPFGAKKGGKVKGFRDGGIYTADMGQPPQDIDGGSASMKKPMPKNPEAKKPVPKLRGEGTRKIPVPPKKEKMYAKGGSIDGIAQRGKTNCKMR